MSEMEIGSKLFGGYNKKDTEAYIEKLQNMIEELQSTLDKTEEENKEMKEKLTEVQSCYQALWEKCKGQEELIHLQKDTIEVFKKRDLTTTIENVENKIKKYIKGKKA